MMWTLRFVWRALIALGALVMVLLAVPVLGLAYGLLSTEAVRLDLPASEPPPQAIAAALRAEIPSYQRPEESTFLTYPEWAIVYAAREYAGVAANRSPVDFPYWGTIGRFWRDYATVIRATEGYPFNFANHQMLAVIGTSHTVEHALQWSWENTVGRLSQLVGGHQTGADRFLAGVAAEYAGFLDQTPWYEFPYEQTRRALGDIEPAAGESTFRTGERRFAYGLAYLVKQFYADAIRSGLSATAAPALLDIHVWARGPVAQAIAGEPDTRLVKDLGPEGAVFVTRRYQVFTEMLPRLASKGLAFREIGGNGTILLTALSDRPVPPPVGAGELFSYPLPSAPEVFRTGLVAAVTSLHEVLPALERRGARLEHVYDY